MTISRTGAAIREALTPAVRPYTDALIAVLDWCDQQREHAGTIGDDVADQLERLIADKLGLTSDVDRPFLDKGGADGDDDTEDVPDAVFTIAQQRLAVYKAAHRGHYPAAPFDAGNNSERGSVGLPGHCSVCAIIGHVIAHPERGCADVGCDSDHAGPGQFTRHTCTPDGKALPYGRKAAIGECLRCDQLRAGAMPREAHPAIQSAARKREFAEQTDRDINEHFAPGGPHQRGECGPVCTRFDY